MKGSKFVEQPKTRQHLKDDYEDPELPPLPPVMPHELQRDDCTSIGSQSLRNVLSDPWLVDHLDVVGYWGTKRVTQDVDFIKSQREIILRRSEEVRARKTMRLAQRDTEKALEKLVEEGFELTHEIMQAFVERDQAMLDALKTVQSNPNSQRYPLRNSRDARFILNVLKEWETAFKESLLYRGHFADAANHQPRSHFSQVIIEAKGKLSRKHLPFFIKALKNINKFTTIVTDLKSARTQDNFGKAASKLIYMGWYFHKKDDQTYYWLVYELYHLAIKSSQNCKGKINEAIARYLLGKFLVQKANHIKEAAYHLMIARDLSYGYNWTTTFFTEVKEDHIHKNSNYLLHVILIKRAVDCSFKRPLKAINFGKEAVRLIKSANEDGPIADAYFDLAVIYNRAHMPDRAILTVNKALDLYVKRDDGKNCCLALLFGAHCLRRMNDYDEAVKTLQAVIYQAKHYKLPSMEAKGYKHLAEYFLGRGKFESAKRYYQKSYELFEKCDLKDELDEVSTAHSYTAAWLRIHDVYYLLMKAVSKQKHDFFDFVDFVELGVPCFNRSFPLRFVYKMMDHERKGSSSPEPTPISQPSLIHRLADGSYMHKLMEKANCEDDFESEMRVYHVSEFYAFSDMISFVHDEELEQAMNLFTAANIDLNSDIAVKAMQKVPFKHRAKKRSITNLVCLEIAAAQILICQKNGLYALSIVIDRNQIERKLHLLDFQLDESTSDDYEKKNEHKLWSFTVEVHPSETFDIYEEWKSEALKGVELLKYSHDSPPKHYGKLLRAMLPLANIYRLYDQMLKIRKEMLAAKIEKEVEIESSLESRDQSPGATQSVSLKPVVISVPSHDTSSAKASKVCRCKEIL